MAVSAFSFFACGGGNAADALGVAAECAVEEDCPEVTVNDEATQLKCLTQFKGGYCAIEDCTSNVDCPEGASCVAHEDGENYCFRQCTEKAECNANRSGDNQANCSGNFTYADEADDVGSLKACIPPSN